jgi:hypothetical protein
MCCGNIGLALTGKYMFRVARVPVFIHYANHDSALSSMNPRQNPMNAPAFSVVRTVRTQAEAEMLISFLRSAGLHPLDLDTSSHFSLAGADISFHIEVPTTELEPARELLKSHDCSPGN